jgi:hypothetical protein
MKVLFAIFLALFSVNAFAAEFHFLSTDGNMAVDGSGDKGPWLFVTTGRPGESFNFTTSGNECGNYDSDGLGTYTASIRFSGTGSYKTVVWLDLKAGNAGKNDRMEQVIGAASMSNGVRCATITQYKEDLDDDAECVQGGLTYYKYICTY